MASGQKQSSIPKMTKTDKTKSSKRALIGQHQLKMIRRSSEEVKQPQMEKLPENKPNVCTNRWPPKVPKSIKRHKQRITHLSALALKVYLALYILICLNALNNNLSSPFPFCHSRVSRRRSIWFWVVSEPYGPTRPGIRFVRVKEDWGNRTDQGPTKFKNRPSTKFA